MRETEFICSPSHLEVLRRACKCTARLISPDTAIDAEDATVQELGAAILSVYVLLGDAADELSGWFLLPIELARLTCLQSKR